MSQQKADEAFAAFQEFVKARNAADDWINWADTTGSVMSPAMVCKAIEIGTSALRQNSRIKKLRGEVEAGLRRKKVYVSPSDVTKKSAATELTSNSNSKERAKMKRLEERNAALEEEVSGLKSKLVKANIFEEHLLETGRALPL
ncbi:MAG: hypothetical protein DRP64_18900 [Verrucomicrobia bacterium]|nr:MAG: hypothetical protein DRP64_18900 [Verrucomicrobiota bacterium]